MRTRLTLLAILAATSATVYAQWTIQTSNSTADLRGIHSIGGGVAWASGTNGTVLRTEDGGYVWQSCSVPPGAEKLDFRGLQAFDANTAIVMSSGPGDLSRLYKTTDGCHSWKLIFTNPDKDGFWDALKFTYLDPKYGSGWLLGDPVKGEFALFAISEGGRKWTRQENARLRAAPKQGAFAASNSSLSMLWGNGGVAFGTGGNEGAKIYRETFCKDHCPKDPHGRKNEWDVQKVPVGGGSEASGVFSLAEKQRPTGALDSYVVVAVGGDYVKPDQSDSTAAFSSDGGTTWNPAQTSPLGYRSAVAYEPSFKTWITVGPNGTDVSTDDGKNWCDLHPDPALHEAADADRNWNALSLPFVVGPHGRIGKLDDGALKRCQSLSPPRSP